MEHLFPYRFRRGQLGLVRFVQETVWGEGTCVNAATGFGKTPAILGALLPYVLKFGQKIVWAVRTGSGTDRPIEELKCIDQRLGSKFFGLSYRGKRDMCLRARDLHVEGELDYADVAFLCESEGDECPYRQNAERFNPLELAKGPLLYSELLRLCREREVCPYLVQRELLPFADVVSLSYNYVLDPKLGWSIKRSIPFNRSFLVVDEAHNLQHACSSLNSDRVTLGTVDRALRELGSFDAEETRGVRELGLALREGMLGARRLEREEAELDAHAFVDRVLELLRTDLDELAERFKRMRDYGTRVRRRLLRQRRRPRSSLFHLANFWLDSLEQLEIPGVAFLIERDGGIALERWDMRASAVLRDRWKEFRGCVFSSGTLSPVRAFAETVGLDAYAEKRIPAHYDPRKICSLITRGLTTRGEELSAGMARRYVRAIQEFVRSLRTNLAVFSSSYRIQQGFLRAGLREAIEAEGRACFEEFQGMSGDRGREVLEGFKACAGSEHPGVLCATAQGRFAEGADFPGAELEGIFLAGIPFERMSVRTELYLDYYAGIYGKGRGTYYAYVVPALRRAAQSLGRALRSSEERAVFVCGDERYAQPRFFRLLPDFVRAGAKPIDPVRLPAEISSWLGGSGQ